MRQAFRVNEILSSAPSQLQMPLQMLLQMWIDVVYWHWFDRVVWTLFLRKFFTFWIILLIFWKVLLDFYFFVKLVLFCFVYITKTYKPREILLTILFIYIFNLYKLWTCFCSSKQPFKTCQLKMFHSVLPQISNRSIHVTDGVEHKPELEDSMKIILFSGC